MLLLLKFKAWLRNWLMTDGTAPVMGSDKPATIDQGAAQLIDRARQGDQNAIALICQVRDNAKKGLPRAIKAYKAMMRYAKTHPVKAKVSYVGAESQSEEIEELANDIITSFGTDYVTAVTDKLPDLFSVSVPMAIYAAVNGPSLLPGDGDLFLSVRKALTPESDKAFMVGYKYGTKALSSVPGDLRDAFLLGHVLGTARRIQAVRLPDMPISVLAPKTGFELGEEWN